jgi:hypothetical protein
LTVRLDRGGFSLRKGAHEMAGTYKGKSTKLGGGGRFAKLRDEIAAKGNVSNPDAVAAAVGRKRLGKAAFQKLAAEGRKRAKG